MAKWTTLAPAKINLSLRIGPPGPGGYHQLDTFFQSVGLFDEVEVEEIGATGAPHRISFGTADIPADNTVTKALRLAAELAIFPQLKVSVVKNIPIEAGLGGGSSNAAAVLRILRQLAPPSVPDREFVQVAEAVGADVPFFLVGGRAHGTRFGDVVAPLPDEPLLWRLIVRPPVAASTPAMFKLLDAARSGEPANTEKAPLPKAIDNDFHLVAPEPCLEVLRQGLDHDVLDGGLCGSGSCVFFSAATPEPLHSLQTQFSDLQTWLVRDVPRSEALAVHRIDPS